jgi:hypothetical protein
MSELHPVPLEKKKNDFNAESAETAEIEQGKRENPFYDALFSFFLKKSSPRSLRCKCF